MAKRKSSSAPTERGVALVELVIEHASREKDPRRKPLPPELIAKLTFPNGAKLPATLAAWLAFDSSDFPVEGTSLKPVNIRDYLLDGMHPALAEMIGPSLAELPGAFYPLDELLFYWVGKPAKSGEYPILYFGQAPEYFSSQYPGFDVYLAAAHGLFGDDHWRQDPATLRELVALDKANPDMPGELI